MTEKEFDDDLEAILVCAVRYAVGRETYMPGIVQEWIIKHPERLSEKGIEAMIDAITARDRFIHVAGQDVDCLGDTKIDRPNWLYFRNWLSQLLKQRRE